MDREQEGLLAAATRELLPHSCWALSGGEGDSLLA